MTKDYDKEIKEARELIRKLEAEKHSETIGALPDLKGRYFKAAWKTFYKVLEVVDTGEEDEVICDVFYIRVNEDDTQACIDSYQGYCGVYPSDEITEEEFMKWYNKALNLIKL